MKPTELSLAASDIPLPAAIDLKVPAETAPPENTYAQRAPEVREQVLEAHGGDKETEAAVRRALAWLARHQSEDGHWDSDGFDEGCGECEGGSTVDSDMAVTALALLCFFGADHTHLREGEYRDPVRKALAWIVKRQSEDGDLRAGESMYTHGIAAIALAEAYGMTKDPALRDPVAKAVGFIVAAKSARGGWRYEPGQPGDTSVLGWQVMALVSAQRAGIDVPASALKAGHDWLDRASEGRDGVYSYQRSSPPSASMTAEGLFCRQLLGDRRETPRTTASIEYLRGSPPKWGRRSTTYYWYYGTMALFQHGGEDWDRWNTAVKRELLAHQEKDGAASGSWDPLDRWSLVGGRVYQTAICTLTLEVYYRYLPLYRRDEVAGR